MNWLKRLIINWVKNDIKDEILEEAGDRAQKVARDTLSNVLGSSRVEKAKSVANTISDYATREE
ncbi:MAG: hypothetical protein AAGA75_20590 [Cyanobacteria bacterium P01_E01_bin.6]